MIHEGAAPIGQQIAVDILAPPIVTAIWWLLAGGWSRVVGTSRDQTVQSWFGPATWIVLTVCYTIAFSITAYGFFF